MFIEIVAVLDDNVPVLLSPVAQPLVAASLTLIYVDRRMRAEGLDIQLTRAAQAAAAASGPLRT